MLNYTLPDFTVGLDRNLFFIRLFETHPDLFQSDVRIDSVYGCFPDCIANGGRAFIRPRYSRAQIEETFALLAEHRITARLTLTNMLIDRSHLDDGYLKTILDAARAYGAEAIVYTNAIDELVRDGYGLKRVLSTTKGIDTIDEMNCALDRYDFVVLNYNRNKDRDFIDGIRDRGRVEVMVNEFCSHGCPHRERHYLHNSEDQMAHTIRPFPACGVNGNAFIEHKPGHPVLFTDDEVRSIHDECGIDYFKIVGRGIPGATVLEAYVYYLIRPAYRERVRHAYLTTAQRR